MMLMEKPLITIVHENDALIKLHAILPALGFRVRAFVSLSAFMSSPEKTSSEAVILDRRSAGVLIRSFESAKFLSNSENRPVIVISEDASDFSDETSKSYIELPNDLLILFRFLQEKLPVFSRKHLRLKIRLPGIYCHGEGCHVAEIMSLGTGGAFVKTGWHRLRRDDLIRIGIPLLGLNRELEIEGRVIYLVEPNEENNYLQGVGVRFTRPETDNVRIVEDYIRYFLREELYETPCVGSNFPPLDVLPPRITRPAGDARVALKF
jgi:Tfp pilus assembly protein PilZ